MWDNRSSISFSISSWYNRSRFSSKPRDVSDVGRAVGFSTIPGALTVPAMDPSQWRANDFDAFFDRWEKESRKQDPAGWKAHACANWTPQLDVATGFTYWWHKNTREVQWDLPEIEGPRWRRLELYFLGKLDERFRATANKGLGSAGWDMKLAQPIDIKMAIIKSDGTPSQTEPIRYTGAGEHWEIHLHIKVIF